MTDDQGWGDLGSHGNPVLETPRLDALAAAAVELSQFYVHPVCTPTRAALFTGRAPQRSTAIDTYRGRAMLAPEAVTVAEVLREAGMATGLFGKWHLGDEPPLRPLDQGFERSLVHRGGGIGQPSDPIGAEGRYTDPVLMDQGIERELEGYCTDIYFREAMDWMREQDAAGRRFFCAITPNAPHTPLHDVPEALRAKYAELDLSPAAFASEPGRAADFRDENQLARLYAMIENIDANMGALVDFLEAEGLAEETLLLFLCDNGPQGRRYNQGLRAAKGSVYEGGVRSPLLARWPAGGLEARRQEAGYASHLDLFPTILEACGVGAPEDLDLDGASALGLLRGEPAAVAASRERPLVIQWHRGDFPVENHHLLVRLGDEKLVNATRPWDELEEPPAWAPELYDLEDDPYEQRDLAAERPERVAELEAIYRDWFLGAVGPTPEHLDSPGQVALYRRLRYAPPAIRLGGEGPQRVVLTRQDWRPDEGGGWGRNGAWSVSFADSRPWRVRVVPQQGMQPTRVVLGINSGVWTHITHEGLPEPGAREVVLEGITHWRPDAPASVIVRVEGPDGERRGPHQVIFER
jgi:arylsulfatase/arylsulfatase A